MDHRVEGKEADEQFHRAVEAKDDDNGDAAGAAEDGNGGNGGGGGGGAEDRQSEGKRNTADRNDEGPSLKTAAALLAGDGPGDHVTGARGGKETPGRLIPPALDGTTGRLDAD